MKNLFRLALSVMLLASFSVVAGCGGDAKKEETKPAASGDADGEGSEAKTDG